MSIKPIDAEYRGEERYAKISFAYSNDEQYQQIENALAVELKNCDLDHNIYGSDISNGRKVLIIEFHDDYDRQSGQILENLIKKLGITECRC